MTSDQAGRCNRRSLLTAAIAIAGCGTAAAETNAWAAFKTRFISADGRVTDTGNGGISHSEGQGWGMLLAVAENDQDAFDLLWRWTRRTLRRPEDGLHSWRFRPNSGSGVEDRNNATDGDLYIGWALANAARRWGRPEFRVAAARIAQSVLRLCTLEAGGMLVLVPGIEGFTTLTRVTINPSYFVFPAFRILAEVAPDPRWQRLERDALQLVDRGRFGTWMLPPDWLSMERATGQLQPAEGWPPRFGFDAVRVPLLLGWGRHADAPALAAARSFWTTANPSGAPPAWVDLRTAERAPYPASAGVLSIARFIEAGATGRGIPPTPVLTTDYYASTLSMLAALATRELAEARP